MLSLLLEAITLLQQAGLPGTGDLARVRDSTFRPPTSCRVSTDSRGVEQLPIACAFRDRALNQHPIIGHATTGAHGFNSSPRIEWPLATRCASLTRTGWNPPHEAGPRS